MKIKCPSCGAEFEKESGFKVLKCPFCGSSIFISDETGTIEKIIPLITFDGARDIFKKNNIQEDFELVYIPFYKVLKDGKEEYIIGIRENNYELKRFIPQGDRISIEKNITELEIKIEKPLSVVFSPFYRTKKGDYLCAVSGKIIRKEYDEGNIKHSNFLPVFIFIISGLLAILIKQNFLKFIIPLILSSSVFLLKDEKYNIN
uniref:Zinc ribbon domain-containing protein n=1 Tax=candidate division WOR-3 bacterium TaxID=2052148 RepID=A0A7C4YCD5_UNCW3